MENKALDILEDLMEQLDKLHNLNKDTLLTVMCVPMESQIDMIDAINCGVIKTEQDLLDWMDKNQIEFD